MSTIPDPRLLHIADYSYELPDERIARYPLPDRDAAKLLVYKEGLITGDTFNHLHDHLPKGSLLVVNNAKVVRARMIFKKSTGGNIEIFCLEPHPQYSDITTAMAQTGTVLWQCLVGGAAKWKHGGPLLLSEGGISLRAEMHSKNEGDFSIRFSWHPSGYSFAEVLAVLGRIPLPPYLGRAAEASDETRYQTMFAANEGSVAAPTASLHFTDALMDSLNEAGVRMVHLTLHVGAGTFKPVKSELAGDHRMHHEWIEVSKNVIESLLNSGNGPVVAGGTTALRTLESLYWIGCKIMVSPALQVQDLVVDQWEPYSTEKTVSRQSALEALIAWMEAHGLEKIIARTGILIAPGYSFRVVEGLITNFHQPQSTLLLLVAAFIGDDWRQVYNFAMQHDFRFLSYGDGSLLWRNPDPLLLNGTS